MPTRTSGAVEACQSADAQPPPTPASPQLPSTHLACCAAVPHLLPARPAAALLGHCGAPLGQGALRPAAPLRRRRRAAPQRCYVRRVLPALLAPCCKALLCCPRHARYALLSPLVPRLDMLHPTAQIVPDPGPWPLDPGPLDPGPFSILVFYKAHPSLYHAPLVGLLCTPSHSLMGFAPQPVLSHAHSCPRLQCDGVNSEDPIQSGLIFPCTVPPASTLRTPQMACPSVFCYVKLRLLYCC